MSRTLLRQRIPKRFQVVVIQRHQPALWSELEGMREPRLGDPQLPKLALVAGEVVVQNRLVGQPLHSLQQDGLRSPDGLTREISRHGGFGYELGEAIVGFRNSDRETLRGGSVLRDRSPPSLSALCSQRRRRPGLDVVGVDVGFLLPVLPHEADDRIARRLVARDHPRLPPPGSPPTA